MPVSAALTANAPAATAALEGAAWADDALGFGGALDRAVSKKAGEVLARPAPAPKVTAKPQATTSALVAESAHEPAVSPSPEAVDLTAPSVADRFAQTETEAWPENSSADDRSEAPADPEVTAPLPTVVLTAAAVVETAALVAAPVEANAPIVAANDTSNTAPAPAADLSAAPALIVAPKPLKAAMTTTAAAAAPAAGSSEALASNASAAGAATPDPAAAAEGRKIEPAAPAAAVSPDAPAAASFDAPSTGPVENTPAIPASPSADGASQATATGSTPTGSTLSRASIDMTAQIAAQIIRKLDSASSRFEMKLLPEELGRVDVKLDIDAEGRLSARLAFDNPLAAADMRGRVDELRRQLEQAGFQISDNALEFAERDTGSHAFDRGDDQPSRARAFSATARLSIETDALAVAAQSRLSANGGLDMRV